MSRKLWISEHSYINLAEHNSMNDLLREIALRPNIGALSRINLALPNPDPILKRQGKDISTYRDLLVDSHVWSTVQSRKAGTLRLEWSIDRGKARSRIARFVDDIFSNQSFRIRQTFSDILEAVQFGYQALEVFWERRNDFWIPMKVIGKPQEWFHFDYDNRLRYRPLGGAALGELLPEKKFLIAQYYARYDNPYGEPTLARCFWPAVFKKGGWKFWVKFTEKFGMPFIIGKHPRGQDQKEVDTFADILEDMVQDAVAVIPDDGSVEIVQTGGTGNAEIYNGLIAVCNSEISKAEVGHSGAADSTPGKLGQEDTALQVRQDLIDQDKQLAEEVANQLIDWIVGINFGENAERPMFSMWEEEDVDKALAERDEILTRTGIKFTKVYFQKNYGLEEEDFDILPVAQPGFLPGGSLPGNFAATPDAPADQAALDEAISALPDEELQGQIETVLEPLLKYIQNGDSYETTMANLVKQHPKLDTAQLEELLARAIFVSEVWGRLNAPADGGAK